MEDEGWHRAAGRYKELPGRHRRDRVLYLELGAGYNTPGIIKYLFWQMTAENPKAVYACINYGEAGCLSMQPVFYKRKSDKKIPDFSMK